MRVLWSIHLYPPSHNCGSEFVAHLVNKFLISRGHECRVVLHRDNNINTPYIYEGVEVFGSKVGTMVDTYRWANIICTHLDFTSYTIIMSKQARRPMVQFVHNDIPYDSMLNSFGNVSAVYNSDWIAGKIGYTIPGFTLHPPCDCQDYKVETTCEYITLISLNERKGGYLFYQIAKAMPDKKFLGVIGSYDNPGPLKMVQMDIINQLMQLPNFTLIPNTPDIKATYAKTRLLLMPSDYESWGRTATEAMCSGIPVICTPTPGLIENCGDAAIYVGKQIKETEEGGPQVEIGTADEWVKAIRQMDCDKMYQKYSVLCTQRAAELNPVKELESLEQFLLNAQSYY